MQIAQRNEFVYQLVMKDAHKLLARIWMLGCIKQSFIGYFL